MKGSILWCKNVLGVGGKFLVVGKGDCEGWLLWEKWPATQLEPLQDTAEPISQVDDASMEVCLRNDKMLHRQWGEAKRVRNNPANTKVREWRGRGRKCLRCGSKVCPTSHERDHWCSTSMQVSTLQHVKAKFFWSI